MAALRAARRLGETARNDSKGCGTIMRAARDLVAGQDARLPDLRTGEPADPPFYRPI